VAITVPQYSAIKSPQLRAAIWGFSKNDHTEENVLFLDALIEKKTPEVIYKTYVASGSPKFVNLPDSIKGPLDTLSKAKKWRDMPKGLEAARKNINYLTDQVIHRFRLTPAGQRSIIMWRMGLGTSQVLRAGPLLKVYFEGHTPEDKWAAYQALLKISSKTKAALTENGTPPPATAPTEAKDRIAKNLAVDKLAKQLAIDLKACNSYLESANQSIAREGLPRDPLEVDRMYESGRMRHDKVVNNWNKAIRSDQAFKTKYKTVAADKEKCDKLWGTYSTKLKH
jgi:hypothetical protein